MEAVSGAPRTSAIRNLWHRRLRMSASSTQFTVRGEPHLLGASRDLPYPSERMFTALPGPVPGSWFALSDSSWPGPFPPSPPPGGAHPVLCSATSQVLRTRPTAHVRSSRPCPLRVLRADHGAITVDCSWALPASAQKASTRARGHRLRGTHRCLAMAAQMVLPSDSQKCVGVPIDWISELISLPMCAPVNASRPPLRASRA